MKGRSRVGQPGARTKTLGELLAERRKELGISQKEMAALIKNRDGKPITSAYLNYLEHDRGEPPGYLLDQFAEILRISRDVLYFWTRRMPPDIEPGEASPEKVTAAYRAFRRELKGGGDSKGGGKKR
jgi:transcriptional regulator with XRE-family HTH domain